VLEGRVDGGGDILVTDISDAGGGHNSSQKNHEESNRDADLAADLVALFLRGWGTAAAQDGSPETAAAATSNDEK